MKDIRFSDNAPVIEDDNVWHIIDQIPQEIIDTYKLYISYDDYEKSHQLVTAYAGIWMNFWFDNMRIERTQFAVTIVTPHQSVLLFRNVEMMQIVNHR